MENLFSTKAHSLITNKLSPAQNQSDYRIGGFEGSTKQLAQFLSRCWSDAYAGRMPFPIWSEDYLDWQLPDTRRHLAAYHGDRLAAVLLGTPFDFRTVDETYQGAQWSWLSVSTEDQGCGLAKRLDQERVSLERKLGSELVVSYRFMGSRHSKAERPHAKSPTKRFHRKLGMWTRPIDASRIRLWNYSRIESALGQAFIPLLPTGANISNVNIRKLQEEDITACVSVLKSQTQRCAVTIHWTAARLQQHLLATPFSHSIVMESHGQIVGLVVYHILEFQGRTREPVAIIDLIAFRGATFRQQRQLLLHTVRCVRDQGALFVIKLRSGDVSAALMTAAGFLMKPPDTHLVFQWVNQQIDIPRGKPLHLLWR